MTRNQDIELKRARRVLELRSQPTKLGNVLDMLTRQKFADWYETDRFFDYISGSRHAPTDEEILADLKAMLGD